jgi:iron complex outermembrane receptor protein
VKRLFPTLLVIASGSSFAQEDRMEHVLVSVPMHKKTAETALPISILSGQELQRAAATSIGETLGQTPGIASASFGPGVGRPVIRGQQGPRTLTLQNGTSSADVSSLSPDHAVAVEPLLATSIEVLRGPSTLLYGGGAIGGVVNVIDNRIPLQRIEGVRGAVEYRYDDAPGLNSGVAKLEAGSGNASFHLSGTTRDFDDLKIPGKAIDEAALERQEELLGSEHEDGLGEIENTDGFIANTDGDADAVTAGASYHLGDQGFFGLAISHLETQYGIPPGAHGHEEDHGEEAGPDGFAEEEEEAVRIDLEQTRYDGLVHLHDLLPGYVDILRGFVTYTDYQHVELEGANTGTRFDRDTWEGRLELVHEGELSGVVGIQLRADEFVAVGEEAYVPRTDSTEWGLFLVEDFHQDAWHFEAGARVDWVERDPDAQRAGARDFTSYSLSGAVIRQLTPTWSVSWALSHSQRAPATEELFANIDATVPDELVTHAATSAIAIGDADLDEESSLNTDLSISWESSRSWAELTLFYNSFEDYIFLLNTGDFVDDTPVYAYSQEDADFYGVEFESQFFLANAGSGELALKVFGDVITGEFDQAGDVPRMPPARLGGELSWTGDRLGTWLRVLSAADQDNPGDFETETDGYTRWDAGVDYRWQLGGDHELLTFLKWKNIGDEEIRLSTSFLRNYAPQAGQSIEAGIRYSF